MKEKRLKNYAIIVAGGSGSRFCAGNSISNTAIPKQFILLNNKPLLVHTLERFINYNIFDRIVLVLPENEIEYWQQISSKYNIPETAYTIAKGGKTRLLSVCYGLNALVDCKEDSIVAVHDGVRIFTNKELILKGIEVAYKYNNAVPCMTPTESIRLYDESSLLSRSIDRRSILSVQTPQFAKLGTLHRAFEEALEHGGNKEFTDESSVLEFFGQRINIIEGLVQNIKITTPYDLNLAKFLIDNKY